MIEFIDETNLESMSDLKNIDIAYLEKKYPGLSWRRAKIFKFPKEVRKHKFSIRKNSPKRKQFFMNLKISNNYNEVEDFGVFG